MKYAIIIDNKVANVVLAGGPMGPNWVRIDLLNPEPGINWSYDGAVFTAPPAPVIPADPAQWFIDVGPFFDRFGAAKMNVLVSSNTTVQALVKDLQIRKWIDLQRAEVAAGIDALIALGVSGVDNTLKTTILTTPVTAEENMALRKVYF